MSLPRPGDRYGKFQLVRMIGRGGMGAVFEATDTVLKRQVALKVVLPTFEATDMFTARFEREATVLARVRSRHIVNIHEFGEHEGTAFLVTELFPDGDLRSWVDANGPFAPLPALTLIDQIFAGLQDAHDAGVLHRDIKPSNILLWNRPDGMLAYLCDFGIAADGESGLTSTGTVLGSYAYMAPERHTEVVPDVRSDIYSVGCLLYALLTGHAPYEGSDFQVTSMHINGPLPQIHGIGEVTEALNKLLARLLAKDPDDRPATVAQARREVARLIDLASESTEAQVAETPNAVAHEDEATSVRTPTPILDPAPILRHEVVAARDRRSARNPVFAAVTAAAILVGGGVLVTNLAHGDDNHAGGPGASPSAPLTSTVPTAAHPLLRKVTDQVRVPSEPQSVVLSSDQELLYVSSRTGGTLTLLTASPLKVRRSITLGGKPSDIAVVDKTHVLVSLGATDQLALVDTASGVITKTGVGNGPVAVTLTPDRRTAWVANEVADTISVLDVRTLKVTATIPVGNAPADVVFAPDGSTAYVPNFDSDDITAIDTRTLRPRRTFTVAAGPSSLAVRADGKRLYVACFKAGQVDVVDLESAKVLERISIRGALGFSFSPGEKELYVTSQDGPITVIRLSSNTVLRSVASVPTWLMAISNDGTRGYVSNNEDNTVSLLRP